jgi:small subunit ribosomal protein S1
VLSRDKARREESWDKLERSSRKGERVEGVIFGRVKGGFTVDLGGAVAFLPARRSTSARPRRRPADAQSAAVPDPQDGPPPRQHRRLAPRRARRDPRRTAFRTRQNLAEGQVIDGVVKNITDYGAFVDLGGIDGLLHVTDMSWKRVNHPSEVLNIGQTVKVQIIRINPTPSASRSA